MTTKNAVDAAKFLERLTGGPLTLGRLITSIRLGEKISQAAFAKTLGISRQNLCDIEKGRASVSPARAALWANKLGYSERQFVSLALQALVDNAGLRFDVIVAPRGKRGGGPGKPRAA